MEMWDLYADPADQNINPHLLRQNIRTSTLRCNYGPTDPWTAGDPWSGQTYQPTAQEGTANTSGWENEDGTPSGAVIGSVTQATPGADRPNTRHVRDVPPSWDGSKQLERERTRFVLATHERVLEKLIVM